MIGLKRGTVLLVPHEKEWETAAAETILRLKGILKDAVLDAAHVGSTSIPSIMAKPIIDVALAVPSFERILAHEKALAENGFFYRAKASAGLPNQLLLASGSYYEGTGDLQTRFVHVVLAGSREWRDYIHFRDYLIAHPETAREYEALKLALWKAAPVDPGREKYTAGKHAFIARTLVSAEAWSFLGKTVDLVIDRPLGSVHPDHPDLVYPVNYGSLPGVPGGDGEDLDAYLVGVDAPVSSFRAEIVGFVRRRDDAEDKLIAAPPGVRLSPEEAERILAFQERFFDHEIELLR